MPIIPVDFLASFLAGIVDIENADQKEFTGAKMVGQPAGRELGKTVGDCKRRGNYTYLRIAQIKFIADIRQHRYNQCCNYMMGEVCKSKKRNHAGIVQERPKRINGIF